MGSVWAYLASVLGDSISSSIRFFKLCQRADDFTTLQLGLNNKIAAGREYICKNIFALTLAEPNNKLCSDSLCKAPCIRNRCQ